jgi:hypothetical protein
MDIRGGRLGKRKGWSFAMNSPMTFAINKHLLIEKEVGEGGRIRCI